MVEEKKLSDKERELLSRSAICYVCLRVTYEDILECARKVWSNEDVATKMAEETRRLIKEIYKKDPVFFCGKSRKAIVGSLFYIIDQEGVSQRKIAEAVETTEVAIRNNCKRFEDVGVKKILPLSGGRKPGPYVSCLNCSHLTFNIQELDKLPCITVTSHDFFNMRPSQRLQLYEQSPIIRVDYPRANYTTWYEYFWKCPSSNKQIKLSHAHARAKYTRTCAQYEEATHNGIDKQALNSP